MDEVELDEYFWKLLKIRNDGIRTMRGPDVGTYLMIGKSCSTKVKL